MSPSSCSLPLLAKTITHPAARSLCDSWASCSINNRLRTGRSFTINVLTTGILWRLESTEIRFRPGLRQDPAKGSHDAQTKPYFAVPIVHPLDAFGDSALRFEPPFPPNSRPSRTIWISPCHCSTADVYIAYLPLELTLDSKLFAYRLSIGVKTDTRCILTQVL